MLENKKYIDFGKFARDNSSNFYWNKIIEKPLAEITRCGQIRRQQLEVVVENSTAMQELTFRKQELIDLLNREIPQQKLKDIRFRVGTIQQKKK